MSADALDIEARLALAGFDLDLRERLELSGCTAVFGPSGAGKSTFLRLIAGFARPDRGRIAWAGETWCDTASGVFVPARRRGVGVIFQDARLFPHLDVRQNLAYAARRAAKAGPGLGIAEAVDAFDLAPLLHRRPRSLSGGERQRTALARALLSRPRLLLLDEPLSALDRERKAEILPYLETLTRRFGLPSVFVSHSAEDVARLADRVLVLNAGRVADRGGVAETLNLHGPDPGAVLEGAVERLDADYGLARVRVAAGLLSLPAAAAAPGDLVRLRIEARDVAVSLAAPDGLSIRNALPARVAGVDADPSSPFADLRLDASGDLLVARITRAAVDDLALVPGQRVFALIKSASFEP